jgi:hypothetical protein
MTLNIMCLFATLSKTVFSVFMLSVAISTVVLNVAMLNVMAPLPMGAALVFSSSL